MDREKIESLFCTNLTMQEAAALCKCRQPTVKQVWIETFGEEAVTQRKVSMYAASKSGDKNPMKGKIGALHHRFSKTGYISDQNGYKRIHAPDWYTGPKSDGYAREHIVVYCATNGITELPEGMEVHHLDMDKANNDPDNLVMLTTRDHALLHGWVNRTISATTIPKGSRD